MNKSRAAEVHFNYPVNQSHSLYFLDQVSFKLLMSVEPL
jgi:hypothetical protein